MATGTLEGATPRESAAVILVRDVGSGLEVLLVRRHRKASFMSNAFVFPGGIAEPGEDDPRVTAARELHEEASILLAGPEEMHYFAHWITPSIEPRRYSARFYAAVLPEGQAPVFDNQETVDAIWVTPEDALRRATELSLPPPQIRTFLELLPAAAGPEALFALCRERAAHPHAILPRFCPLESGFALLLPWDPAYLTGGQGDALAMPADHPLAVGPSRFVLEGSTWKHIHAPPSANAG